MPRGSMWQSSAPAHRGCRPPTAGLRPAHPPITAPMLDVAVIGAGHNGLVCAAYLARAGLAVECFERRELPGGACVTEELWPGVRASPGAYTLSLLRREIIAGPDLRAPGVGGRA